MFGFEIKEISEKGRAIIATKRFEIGDTIFEEEPFVSCQFSWNAAYGYAACDHCLRPLETVVENVKRLSNSMIVVVPYPEYDSTQQWLQQFTQCPKCKVRYCSEDCRILALKRYHETSCLGQARTNTMHPINILNETWKKIHYPPESSTIMLITRLLAMYNQSNNKDEFMQTLQSFQCQTENKAQNLYHKLLGEDFEEQLKQLHAAFYKAFPDEKYSMFTTTDGFKSLMVLLGRNSQGIATSALADWSKKVLKLPFPEDIMTKLNKYIDDIYEKVDEFAGDFLNNEGSGLYICQSKMNHSCVPNAESTFPYSNDIIVIKAIKPIEKGEEICISYLDECELNRSRHSRQKILKENYLFICQCPKCKFQTNDLNETSEDEEEMDVCNENQMDHYGMID